MKFFLDNCISPKIAQAIHAVLQPEHEVIHLRKIFDPQTPDEKWLKALAKEDDLVVISADWNITRNIHIKQAWRDSRLTVFFLKKGWTNIKPLEQLSKLSHCLPKILDVAGKAKKGESFAITVNGKVEKL